MLLFIQSSSSYYKWALKKQKGVGTAIGRTANLKLTLSGESPSELAYVHPMDFRQLLGAVTLISTFFLSSGGRLV